MNLKIRKLKREINGLKRCIGDIGNVLDNHKDNLNEVYDEIGELSCKRGNSNSITRQVMKAH